MWALVKGAPEILQPFLADAPADYEQAYKQYASQGARYMACPHCKVLWQVHRKSCAEAAHMHLLFCFDLAVMSCASHAGKACQNRLARYR